MMAAGVAFAGAVLFTGLLIPLLRRAQFVDVPNRRSSHLVPTPRGGGLAVLVVICAVVGFTGDEGAWLVVAPAVALGLVGLRDDLRALSSSTRLVAQLAVGILTAWGIVEYNGSTGLWAPAFVALGAVGLTSYVNAFNFMDGINGISALNALLAGTWMVWVSDRYDVPDVLPVGQGLAGAALGFLLWNARSRVFLGDVGSYGLGAMVAGGALVSWAGGVPALIAGSPLVIYLADTGAVIVRRALAGEKLTEAHREHAYQRLVQSGWPQLAVAVWCALAAAIICLIMAGLYDQTPLGACACTATVVAAYLLTPRVARRRSSARVVST